MSELPGDPDDAERLIAGQYSDRPQLRPVLEAVLAALSALGPATVQARKTLLLIRGSKLKLADVDPRLVEDAMRPGHRLVARLQLTGAESESALIWSAESATC